ncbi:glutathione-dependent formaldehyde-activating, GFA [Glomus cerebriforme]|uniref:Glutathione-dependent formaldehyde-activating, GFA n=1 Tax=Glomus cerebriforme TaxID=658196 RepID=A0A397T3P2_9GLOM|nr:glutathione-dependent formaldehyde-activating, GFA [Glomus cerebriforme]
MELQGSCHCEKVKFTVKSHAPVPFMRCYCSICRKVGGGGGYAINILGQARNDTLKVEGMEHVKIYRGIHDKSLPKEQQEECGNRRHFCGECGCMLWAFDPQWSEWCYPFASAIDTPLPEPKRPNCIMLKYKANWARVPGPKEADLFDEYPDASLESWHKKNREYID